ncbi:iron-sulfur cluster assembly scaffold protein [Candidatus Collierbacteria bacterium]|nr:iron-sulfur cluster assembly scaffold protein [Candidatus Collierbacteria bacterium]
MSLYHDLIIDHYKNPRNFGELESPDVIVQEANASCGDLIEFQLKFDSIQNSEFRIQNLSWRGVGCAISTASASLLSEKIQHSVFSIQYLASMTDEDMVKMLGGDISPTRLKCATLSLRALKKALKQFNAKIQSQSILP